MPDAARLLKIVHEDDDEDITQPGVVAVLPGTQLTRKEQAKATAAHAARQGLQRFRDSGERDGALLHALLHTRARSAADHAGHASSRSWVPPGCEEGPIEEWGMRYHRWVALPGTLLGQAWIKVIQSPWALFEALVAVGSVLAPSTIALSGRLGVLAAFFTAIGIVVSILAVAGVAASAAMFREGKQ